MEKVRSVVGEEVGGSGKVIEGRLDTGIELVKGCKRGAGIFDDGFWRDLCCSLLMNGHREKNYAIKREKLAETQDRVASCQGRLTWHFSAGSSQEPGAPQRAKTER